MPTSIYDLPNELLAFVATRLESARASARLGCKLVSCCTAFRDTLMSNETFTSDMRAARNMLVALWFHRRKESWKHPPQESDSFPYKCSQYKQTTIKTLTHVVLPRKLGSFAVAARLLRETDLMTCLDMAHTNLNPIRTETVVKAVAASSSRLTTLDLSDNHLGDNGAEHVATLICDGSALDYLALCENRIGIQGAGALADAIFAGGRLTQLVLHMNDICAGGASMLAKAMENNTHLTRLNLGYNKLYDEGAQAIAAAAAISPWMKILELCGNGIGDPGAEALAEALAINMSLKQLSLTKNHISKTGAAALSVTVGFLTKLFLGFNDVDDEGVEALASALASTSTLQTLYLGGNTLISTQGFDHLAGAVLMQNTLREMTAGSKQAFKASSLKEACIAKKVYTP